jgi:hypothetical protein
MNRLSRMLMVILACLLPVHASAKYKPSTSQNATWTIMIFMNGKNNLEPAALENFAQMAEIGSSPQVNIVVELGRPSKTRYTHSEGDWTGVLRFYVTKGMHPIPTSAINPDDPAVRQADMGSGAALADFVKWGKQSYPARSYMLLIWNHGQGWRLYLSQITGSPRLNLASKYVRAIGINGEKPSAAPPSGEITGGFRSVSFDDDTGHFLYNRDIQNSLQKQKVDVIGFDACLMGMIESAFAFRQIAQVMVASEELVPGDGWKYDSWIADLESNSAMDSVALGKELVHSYQQTYQDTGNMTLSAVDLTKVEGTTKALAALSLLVAARFGAESSGFAAARQLSQNYGDWYEGSWDDCGGSNILRFHGIDLGHFLDSYSAATSDPEIKKSISQVKQALSALIFASYQSSASAGAQFWSSGLAIYFPGSEKDYDCDSDKDGYDVAQVRNGLVKFPPEFVERQGWADLLQQYLHSPAGMNAKPDF